MQILLKILEKLHLTKSRLLEKPKFLNFGQPLRTVLLRLSLPAGFSLFQNIQASLIAHFRYFYILFCKEVSSLDIDPEFFLIKNCLSCRSNNFHKFFIKTTSIFLKIQLNVTRKKNMWLNLQISFLLKVFYLVVIVLIRGKLKILITMGI